MTFIFIHILKSTFKKKATLLFLVSIKMSAININLKIKVKKKGLRIFTRFSHRNLRKRKNMHNKLVLDFLFTSFEITPMLLNNLSNFFFIYLTVLSM